MAPSLELPSCWPPALGRGSMVLSLRLQANVDDAFHTMWLSSELSEVHHKARADANLRESAWVATKEALSSSPWHEPGDPDKPSASVATNRFRKVRFESAPSALATKPFENQETIQCNVYLPGRRYGLEAVTSTSAPYGDKFSIYIRYALSAESSSTCTLLVSYSIDWDPSMNFMLKPMVAKGVDVGLRSAFKTYRQVLTEVHTCVDITEAELAASQLQSGRLEAGEAEAAGRAEGEAAAAAGLGQEGYASGGPVVRTWEAAGPHGGHGAGAQHPSLLGFLSEQLVNRDQIPLLADVIGAGMRSIRDQGLMTRVLAILLTLSLISATVSAVKAVQGFCLAGGPLLWLPCLPITHLVDVPDSTSEVLTAVALVAFVNWAIMRGSEASVAYLNQAAAAASSLGSPTHASQSQPHHPLSHKASAAVASQPPHQPSVQHPPPTSKAAAAAVPTPPASTAAAAAAAVNGKDAGPAAPTRSQAFPQDPAALKAAAAAAAAGGSSKAAAAAAAPAAAAAVGKGAKPAPAAIIVKGATVDPARPTTAPLQLEMQCMSPPQSPAPDLRAASVSAAAGTAAAAAAAAAKKPPTGKSNGGGGNGGDTAATAAAAAVAARSSSARSASPIRSNTVEAAKGALVPAAGNDKERSSPAAAAAAAAVAAVAVAGGPSGSSDAFDVHHLGMDGERSWMDSMADTFKGAWQKSQEPFISFMGTSAEATEYGLMAAVAANNATADDVAGILGSGVHKSKSTTAMGAGADALRLSGDGGGQLALGRSAMSAMLPGQKAPPPMQLQEEEPDVVEEEVFENERFQPFRLWGHSWPGHFLPSDRVGHWSDKLGAPYGPAAMVFDQVAPKLPNDGWRWLKEEWCVDMEGLDVEAVDAEGWFYALDFNYLKRHPGSGKCSTHHFVRRRRWVRTRTRIGHDLDGSLFGPMRQTANKDSSPDPVAGDRSDPSTRLLRTSSPELVKAGSGVMPLELSFSKAGAAGAGSVPATPVAGEQQQQQRVRSADGSGMQPPSAVDVMDRSAGCAVGVDAAGSRGVPGLVARVGAGGGMGPTAERAGNGVGERGEVRGGPSSERAGGGVVDGNAGGGGVPRAASSGGELPPSGGLASQGEGSAGKGAAGTGQLGGSGAGAGEFSFSKLGGEEAAVGSSSSSRGGGVAAASDAAARAAGSGTAGGLGGKADASKAVAGSVSDTSKAVAGNGGSVPDAGKAVAGNGGSVLDASKAVAGSGGSVSDASRAVAGSGGSVRDASRAVAGSGGSVPDASKVAAGTGGSVSDASKAAPSAGSNVIAKPGGVAAEADKPVDSSRGARGSAGRAATEAGGGAAPAPGAGRRESDPLGLADVWGNEAW